MEQLPSLDTLFALIKEWGDNKGLTGPEDFSRQVMKLTEEIGELNGSQVRSDIEGEKDALGDIFVVWTMLLAKRGYDPKDIVTNVYNIISKRTGRTVDGIFIKDNE